MKTQTLLRIALLCAASIFTVGCASNATLSPQPYTKKDGSTGYRAVKTYSQQADIIGDVETTVSASGDFWQKVTTPNAANVPTMRVAVMKPNGSPALDKAGQPIFNEIPMVAQIRPSAGTEAMFSGLNQVIRGLGSFAGTVGASLVGIFAAQGAANVAQDGIALIPTPAKP